MSETQLSASSVGRVTIKVERGLYEQVKAYSDVTGVPVSRIVTEALEDFVATTMQARLEALQATRRSDKVIEINTLAFAAAAAEGRA